MLFSRKLSRSRKQIQLLSITSRLRIMASEMHDSQNKIREYIRMEVFQKNCLENGKSLTVFISI